MNIINNIKKIFEADTKSFTALFQSNEISKSYDNQKPLGLYEISLYLNRAITIKAENVAGIKFILKNKAGEEIYENELLDILNKPNQFFSGYEFWKLYQIYKETTGEAFIYLDIGAKEIFSPKSLKSLHLMNPEQVEIKFNEDGSYKSFVYTNGKKTITYLPEQIIRSYNPNPRSQLEAISPITAGLKEIYTGLQLGDYMAKTLKNGGRVDSVFKMKGLLNKKQLQEIKDDYKKLYAEAQRSGTPLFLGGDGDYTHLALNPQELAYLESRKMNINDICTLTSVPKVLLANVDDIKYSNSEESRKVFLRDTIFPLMKNLVNKLNGLAPEGFELDFVDPTPENREEKRADLETASNVNALTTNEKRQELGYDPIKNGDEVLVPFNLTALGTEETEPVEETKGVKKKSKKVN